MALSRSARAVDFSHSTHKHEKWHFLNKLFCFNWVVPPYPILKSESPRVRPKGVRKLLGTSWGWFDNNFCAEGCPDSVGFLLVLIPSTCSLWKKTSIQYSFDHSLSPLKSTILTSSPSSGLTAFLLLGFSWIGFSFLPLELSYYFSFQNEKDSLF